MFSKILCSLAAVFLLAGCGQPPSRETHSPTHEEPAAEAGLSLNHGERWMANPETTEGIGNMQKLLAAYEGGEEPAQLQELGQALSDDFQLIFKRCTMKGEAHEQLHHFLVPMQPMIQSIKAGGTDQLTPLREHLQTYATYFQ